MQLRRIGSQFLPLILTADCMSSTECRCIAPMVTTAGSVTDTRAPKMPATGPQEIRVDVVFTP